MVRRYAGMGVARRVVQEAIVRGRVIGLGEDIIGNVKLTDRNVILLNDSVGSRPKPWDKAFAVILCGTVSHRLVPRVARNVVRAVIAAQ